MTTGPAAPIISVRGLCFTYNPTSAAPVHALRGIDLDVFPGEYVVIIGHNGSGKSTLARHLNALLLPTAGQVLVDGLDTRQPGHTLAIRRTVGMVFQAPDNQIIASTVEEDVAFGPENLGIPESELRRRVDWALDVVGLSLERNREPQRLSPGQKQRVAIAGAIAMAPRVLVLDEATSMLDPGGRMGVLKTLRNLNRQGMTIIAITHRMEEAVEGSRLVVMEDGRIALTGAPREVFCRADELQTLGLDLPQATALAHHLHERLPAFPADLLTPEEVAAAVAAHRPSPPPLGEGPAVRAEAPGERAQAPAARASPCIEVDDLHYTYLEGTPLEVPALCGASLTVHRGEILGIIGQTGSGKSTLVQHFNGLLRPHALGHVRIDGHDLADPSVDVRRIRQKVGLAFQAPEQQLFERLVGDDVAFGPRQLGLDRPERRERVQWAMEAVGLDFEAFKDRPTFSLSGGEMRKAALAGVLALRPEMLILDESTSGLDPRSRRELLGRLLALHRESGLTLILVSSSMEEIAELVDRVYVLEAGRVTIKGSPRQVFAQAGRLRDLGLDVPQVTQVAQALAARGMPLPGTPMTVAEAEAEIGRILGLVVDSHVRGNDGGVAGGAV